MLDTNKPAPVWRQGGIGGNVIADFDGFQVSFLADAQMGGGPLALASALRGFSGDDESETALIVDGCYYILNGDFRAEYEALASQGVAACIEFFKSKPELHSSWSEQP